MFDFKSRWNIRKQQLARGFSFSRPLILLQSDDWGRVGVRDREGYEQLRASGLHLGENPYDYYSLETAEDVIALRDMLKRHRDSTGRPACLVMNVLLSNLDFQKTGNTGFQNIHRKGSLSRTVLFSRSAKTLSFRIHMPFCDSILAPQP